jgi:hypothetical protein
MIGDHHQGKNHSGGDGVVSFKHKSVHFFSDTFIVDEPFFSFGG